MAWAEQWSITVDSDAAKELNSLADGGPYVTVCPEVGWLQEVLVRMVERDGDYPAYIDTQPMPGNYTFLIQMTPCDWATWDTRYNQLLAWMPVGGHTFTFQVRGMATAKSVYAVVRSITTEPKERRVTVLATAPAPILT